MAATLTDASELTYFSFPIEKVESTADGDLMVWGIATDPGVDSDEQIVDDKFSSKAIADWLASGANVRVQHNAQRDPAGVGVEASTDNGGATWVKSLVVEPVAKRLVEKGVLRAYSVGIARPKIVRDSVARGGRIVGGEIVEISLVDRPANKSCGIQLVKAADDGHAEWVGKVFGSDVMAKGGTVNVDLPSDVSVSFSPADLAKLLEHRRIAEKRMADPDVAKDLSTDDRNAMDAKDFAYIDSNGGRHLPVHDAGHVKAALGRFNQQSFESDDAKRKAAKKILSRARSMGIDVSDDSNVAQAAKVDEHDIGKAKKSKKGKNPPFPGAAPPIDGQDSDGDGADTDKPGSHLDDDTNKPPKVKPGSSKKGSQEVDAVDGPEVEKGAKDCPKCGKGFHADSKLRNCDSCGADLPHANKAADPDEDDDTDADDVPMGAKAGKPTPGAGVTGSAASDVKPVPAHREPDGPAIEDLEHDAGLPTVPDSSAKSGDAEMATAMTLKSLGVPADMGALHDMLCAGFHPSDVTTCYPGRSVAGVDVAAWQAKALDAATGAPLDEALKASAMWQHAVTLKGTDPQEIADIQWEAHKAFRDANPGPASFPKPTELRPASFNRPYLSAGHAAPSPGQDGPNTHAVPSGQVTANGFDRGYLDAGHAADSPSNKGDVISAPVPTGEPSRVYYRNAQRETAKAAMQAMHDHIAATFPDLCPMGGPGKGGEAPLGQRPVPVPDASKSADGTVTIDIKGAEFMSDKDMDALVAKIGKSIGGANVSMPSVATKAVTPDLVKSAIAEATGPMLARLDEITDELKAERKRTKALAKAVDALSALPDPGVAPFKGAAMHNPMLSKTVGSPAGVPTMAEIAERTQVAALSALQDDARNNPDPAQREAAWARIYQMTGLTAPR